jgi:DNA primase
LDALGCAWAVGYNAWAFPMKDWLGNTIGIRLRDHTGHKWAVKGSRAGLFYGEDRTDGTHRTDRIYVCEGPTDTAAGLSIGLSVVGRPSCLGCEVETDRLVRRKKAMEAVIVSDNDGPGYRGALKLSLMLSVPCVVWVPPAKDLRDFAALGGTKELIESLTRSLLWIQPKNTEEPRPEEKRLHHSRNNMADQY